MDSSNQQHTNFLLNSTLDGIFATDLDLKITEWNLQMVRFSGVQKSDCIGVSISSIFPALDNTHLTQKLKKVLRGGFEVIKGMPFNKMLQHGINEFYEGYYSPVFDEKNEIIGLMGVVREIGLRKNFTAQVKIEEANDPKNRTSHSTDYQKISEKHNELVRIVNHSPAIAFSCHLDQERTFIFISDNINQLGYQSNELLEKKASFKNLIHDENYDQIEKKYRNYIISGEKENLIVEYKVVTTFGNQRWIQERSWVQQDDQGKAIAMEGVLVDISVKKFAEEALFASKEHFRLLFEKAPIGMAIINQDGSFSKVNHSFLQLTGYDKSEIYSIKNQETIHPEEAERNISIDNQLFSQQLGSYNEEKRLITKNGSLLYTIEHGAPLQTGSDSLQKLIQVVNITSRKIAENDLLESENRLIQAQTFARLGSWEYWPKNNNLILSSEVYQLFNIEENKQVDAGFFISFLQHEEYQSLLPGIKNFLQDESIDEIKREFKIKPDNQQEKIVQVKAAKIWQEQKLIKIFGFVLDITELKKTEEDLRTRNNELTNFVYKISHDLRSPLSSIAGLLSLLKPMDEENDQYLQMIKNRIEKLDNFIADILTHSKNLYTAVVIGKINMQKVVEEVWAELSHLKNYKKVQLIIDIQNEELYSDHSRVKDITKNIIANAIQYINPSRDEHYVKVLISIDDNQMEAEFIDNGMGIDPKTLPRVFDIFFRGSDTSTGSGIGLYIVKQSVEKLNGKINIHSSTREGTKVSIAMPNMASQMNDIVSGA